MMPSHKNIGMRPESPEKICARSLRGIVPVVVFASLTALLHAEEQPKRPVAETSLALIKESFRYQPQEAAEEVVDRAEPAVVLERLTVVGSFERRQLSDAVEGETRKRMEQKYSLVRGGTLLSKDIGKARLEIGTLRSGSGLTLLRLSW